MLLIGFHPECEEKRLSGLCGTAIARKLLIIGKIKQCVKDLLDDYLGNEGLCIRFNPKGFPQARLDEFNAVCAILKKTVCEKILRILDDYDPEKCRGTNENREYLLRKFGLWTEIKKEETV